MLADLPLWRKEKANKIKIAKARKESIAAGWLLKEEIKALNKTLYKASDKAYSKTTDYMYDKSEHGNILNFGYEIDLERVQFGDHGKPYLIDLNEMGIYFNITHTEGFAAVVIADFPVGIDIERKTDKKFRITDRMFTDNEKNRIHKSENPEREFRIVWTEKESFLKNIGAGITVPLNGFHIESEKHMVVSDGYDIQSKDYFVISRYYEDEEFALSLCIKGCGKYEETAKIMEKIKPGLI